MNKNNYPFLNAKMHNTSNKISKQRNIPPSIAPINQPKQKSQHFINRDIMHAHNTQMKSAI